MPRSSYDDDNEYGSRGGRRDRSPDYYSGGGGPAAGWGEPSRPFRDDAPYEREEMTLMPPAHHHGRANSVPPGNALAYRERSESRSYRGSRHGRSRSRSDDDDDDRSRDRRKGSGSPMSRARHVVEDNFSNSTTGIGAGLLGAVVGGFVANKASDKAFGHKGGHQRRHSGDMPRTVSTLLGAVAGGLGANAFAHHVEGERGKRREREHAHHGRYV